METRHLGRRGTVLVGALAIIGIFMIALTCFVAIIIEHGRYAYAVKDASEKLLMRGRESLTVTQISNTKLRVRNEGSTVSFIVGIFASNPAGGNVRYMALSTPRAVGILETEDVDLPEPVPTGWRVAAVTSYGNIFWEQE